ncbi:MAG TPA: phosphonate ABC transporter, permease protein PhnE [Tepidiformaceae bacterium]|nr:phosphonate ABC transporter, permease protein PhnE [Tepidiformaceae bacterium]
MTRWQESASGVLFGRQPSFSPDSEELRHARERWANPVSRPSLRQVLWVTAFLAFLYWSWAGIEGDIVRLATRLTSSSRVWREFADPDWEVLRRCIDATIVTVQMSVIGILGASLLSLPFGLAAARNVSNPVVYHTTRMFLSLVRSVPDLIWAIIFVITVGLGPFAGTLAIIVGTTGSFGKLFAEAIESVDPRPVEAVRATGAPNLSASLFSILPQAFPLILSYVLFYWESTVRNAAIFGLVGAGGIGVLINTYLGLLRYDRLAVAVLCTLVAVIIIDRVSAIIRARLL